MNIPFNMCTRVLYILLQRLKLNGLRILSLCTIFSLLNPQGKPPYSSNVTISTTYGQCLTFTLNVFDFYTTRTVAQFESTTIHHSHFIIHMKLSIHIYTHHTMKKIASLLLGKANLLIKVPTT